MGKHSLFFVVRKSELYQRPNNSLAPWIWVYYVSLKANFLIDKMKNLDSGLRFLSILTSFPPFLYPSMHWTLQINFCSVFISFHREKLTFRLSVNPQVSLFLLCLCYNGLFFEKKTMKIQIFFSIWPLDVAQHSGSTRNQPCILKLLLRPPGPTPFHCLNHGLLSHVLMLAHLCLAVCSPRSLQPSRKHVFQMP